MYVFYAYVCRLTVNCLWWHHAHTYSNMLAFWFKKYIYLFNIYIFFLAVLTHLTPQATQTQFTSTKLSFLFFVIFFYKFFVSANKFFWPLRLYVRTQMNRPRFQPQLHNSTAHKWFFFGLHVHNICKVERRSNEQTESKQYECQTTNRARGATKNKN